MRTLSLAVVVLMALTFLAADCPLLDLSPLNGTSTWQFVAASSPTISGQQPDFGLRFDPIPPLVVGESEAVSMSFYSINNFSGIVHLSASPGNDTLSVTVYPEDVAVPGSFTLTVKGSTPGYFSLGLFASSGSIYHSWGVVGEVFPGNKSQPSVFSSLRSYGVLSASILVVVLGAIVVFHRWMRTRSNRSDPASGGQAGNIDSC